MKIGIASDHAGYLLKEFLKNEFGFINGIYEKRIKKIELFTSNL